MMKKRLLILCDGTWNDLDMRYITNVGWLAQIIKSEGNTKENGTWKSIPQQLYYDDGIGANEGPLATVWNGAWGVGLDRNIYEAYRYLAFNYDAEAQDEICLIGFSRGAYTVRSLAGLLGRVGLLKRDDAKYMMQALDAYRAGGKAGEAFREEHQTLDVSINLLACWDTVGSRGVPDKISWLPFDEILNKRYQFHDTNLGNNIKRALHAVSIHEGRKEFNVTPMVVLPKNKKKQKLKQVWFPGDHGAVGGGSWEKRGLSNHTLWWMIQEAKEVGVDLGVPDEPERDYRQTDHRIYYEDQMRLFYSKYTRSMKKVNFDDVDESAKRRYFELSETQKGQLKKWFPNKLNQLNLPDLVKLPTTATSLQPGEIAYVRVFAKKKKNQSHLQVKPMEKYRISVAQTQVWKDGPLDPCNVRGWNLEHEEKDDGIEPKIPYKNGEKVEPKLTDYIVRRARKDRLVKEADWFELVVSLDGKNYQPLGFKEPASADLPFQVDFQVHHEGGFTFAVNDLASDYALIDKYDNNEGWVWVKVERLS